MSPQRSKTLLLGKSETQKEKLLLGKVVKWVISDTLL